MKFLLSIVILVFNFVCWYGIYEVGTSLFSGSSWKDPKSMMSMPIAQEKKITQATATVTSDALNMRSGPSAENSLIMTLRKGNVITIVEGTEGNNWVKVEYEGKTGYVNKDYINID